MSTPRERLAALLARAGEDEVRVLLYLAERLVGLGQRAYGVLDLSTDRRDFGAELDQELADALVYIACAKLREATRETEPPIPYLPPDVPRPPDTLPSGRPCFDCHGTGIHGDHLGAVFCGMCNGSGYT